MNEVMSLGDMDYRSKLQSYSKSTIQKIMNMLYGAKNEEEGFKITHSVAESTTEVELLKKLEDLEE